MKQLTILFKKAIPIVLLQIFFLFKIMLIARIQFKKESTANW
jgi:hypothetical protein